MDESCAPPVSIDPAENRRRKQAGELYYAFTANLLAERRRCGMACQAFNTAPRFEPRRRLVELWRDITADSSPLPPPVDDAEADEDLLQDAPWVEAPVWMDYGYNVQLGEGVYVNAHSTWIDTCPITVGSRTLIGPNCSFYSGTHPVDPKLRNGTRGPELGKPIHIGADCWLGGNVTVLPGVTIGEGSTVGAGSVVTKDVPPRSVVAGNPARVLRKV